MSGRNGNGVLTSWIQLVALALVLALLAFMFYITVSTFKNDFSAVVGVLGVVLPSVVALGAAIWGAKVSYDAGFRTGVAQGRRDNRTSRDAA
jgi:F0F1-type ATP synthase assembly protein I